MPHKKNAKGDIGTSKVMSDSYNVNNIYLTEEGWVYRHYKRADKSRWWDEVICAGQVKTDITTPEEMIIHGVDQGYVSQTLNDIMDPVPQFMKSGDGYKDIDYKPHVYNDGQDLSKRAAAEADTIAATGDSHDNIPWKPINVDGVEKNNLELQIPEGWSGVSSPSDVEGYPEEPPYPGGAGDGGAGSGDGLGWTQRSGVKGGTPHGEDNPLGSPTAPLSTRPQYNHWDDNSGKILDAEIV